MAGAAIEITRDTLSPALRAAVDNSSPSSLTKLSKNAGVVMLREHADYFREERSPSGAKWEFLKATTLKRRYAAKGGRNRKVFTWRVLQITGALRMSVSPAGANTLAPTNAFADTPGFIASVVGAVRRAGAWGAEIGTNLIYGWPHQKGIKARRGLVREFFREPHTRAGVQVRGHRVRQHWISLPPVPARPFVGFSTRLVDRITRLIASSFWRDKT